MSKSRIIKNTTFIIILILFIFSGFFIYFSIPSQNILKRDTKFSINETLFNNVHAKEVSAFEGEKKHVVVSGETFGVKMYTDGLLVVYVSSVTGKDAREYFPAKDAGICEGDRILSVNGIKLYTNEEFSDYVNRFKDVITLQIARDGEIFTKEIVPVISNDEDKYKVGMWVRDSTAGIGTMTFYCPESGTYAALGHAITDSDTGSMLTISQGSIIDCSIVSIKKGVSGSPGELTGSFTGENSGTIVSNNEFGIYGVLSEKEVIKKSETMEVASRFQVKEGEASILCDIDAKGVKSYSVDIVKVSKEAKADNKGIIIKVTDPELIAVTGGIVQGMSGSPIVQNGKLIGAVTHVFVNDPTRGYGIFIENMLAEAEKIK